MALDASYRPLTYRRAGGDELVVASGGTLIVESGGTISVEAGGLITGLTVTASVVAPDATDGAALGSGTLMWSDLFLASGGVINFNNGDVTITHASNLLTLDGGGLSVGASGAGFDVTLYGDTIGCNFLWDQNLDTNGGLQLGADTKSVNFYAYGLTTGNYLKWDGAADDFSIVGTVARTLHGADAAGNDVIFYGAITGYATTFDANGDTNGSWAFGANTKGMMVSLYGDVTGCGVFWDPTTDTNGTLSIGASGGSKGNDVFMYGATNGAYLKWDQGTDALILAGTATLLSGAGTVGAPALQVGAADTGFYLVSTVQTGFAQDGVLVAVFDADGIKPNSVQPRVAFGTAGAGTVTFKEYGDGRDMTTVLTLTNFIIGAPGAAAAAKGFGNIVYAYPAGIHLELVSSFSAIVLTAAGTAVASDTGLASVVAVGAIALLSTGGATMEDRLTGQTINTAAGGGAAVSALLAATAGIGTGISLNVAASVKNVFLNSAGTWNADNTGNLTATGTIVLKWTRMG